MEFNLGNRMLQSIRGSNVGKPMQDENLQLLMKKGKLDTEQLVYLKRVHSLYRQLQSSKERDRLIYRLNIPPIKVRGLNKPLRATAS